MILWEAKTVEVLERLDDCINVDMIFEDWLTKDRLNELASDTYGMIGTGVELAADALED